MTAPAADLGPVTLRTHDGLDEVADDWDRLALAGGNVFSSFGWLSAWWRHFGRDRPLLVASVWRDGPGPVAVLPLYLATRTPVAVVRFLGHGVSDQCGPVGVGELAGEPADGIAGGLLGALEEAPWRWDALLADDLPAAAGWAERLPGRVLGRTPSLAADLRGHDPGSWLAGRSPSFRAKVRRAERELARIGRVRHRITATPDELERDLEVLFALHHARWAPKGSRAFTGREAFHREVARDALSLGRLRLHVLEVDGRPVAALYNFCFGGVESYYQGGRDPAYDACSVGFLLHVRAIAAATSEGAVEYRFLRGAEAYKQRFADVDHGLVSVGLGVTARGRGAVAALARLPAAPRPVRRRVPAAVAWGTGGTPLWGAP